MCIFGVYKKTMITWREIYFLNGKDSFDLVHEYSTTP
jgi:hypothetical protein